jgi:hypothetical protein
MTRDLVWLEDFSFAAWGCAACRWIMPNTDLTLSDRAPTAIRAAFNQHDCNRFPRHVLPREKRPASRARL